MPIYESSSDVPDQRLWDLTEPFQWALQYTTDLGYRDEARLDATTFLWKECAKHLPGNMFDGSYSFKELGRAILIILNDQFEENLVDVLRERFGKPQAEATYVIPKRMFEQSTDDLRLEAFKQTWDQAFDIIGGLK